LQRCIALHRKFDEARVDLMIETDLFEPLHCSVASIPGQGFNGRGDAIHSIWVTVQGLERLLQLKERRLKIVDLERF